MSLFTKSKPNRYNETADVCLLLEGTYPYVRGGVSAWAHDMIRSHSDLTFHVVCLLPGSTAPDMRYDLPANVLSLTDIFLGKMPSQSGKPSGNLMQHIRPAMQNMLHNEATYGEFAEMVKTLHEHKNRLGSEYLLNSRDAWGVLEDMYLSRYKESSMLDYFWSWRALFGGIFSILLSPLPNARVYHTLCTGYAGLLAARAKIEKQRPVLLTEHGIYTNERRVEISSADWLEETSISQLTIDTLHSDLRDLWMDTFANASRICYEACDEIITLYEGNQQAQLLDGAHRPKMRIIPNGVDIARFGGIQRKPHDIPTIALIGRIVPIKDVKSFIRACAMLRDTLGDLKAYIMGGMDEDPDYVVECKQLAEHLLLDKVIEFTGSVTIDEYLPDVDVVVFTSVSEAQPLVILEVGAAGIPIVSTNVGACSEMINGHPEEDPPLGSGGEIVPLSNPSAVAQATLRLLTDAAYYQSCSHSIKARVNRYYTKAQQHESYGALYAQHINQSKRAA